MSLQKTIENPEMLAAFYSEFPRLERVTLHEVAIYRDGPTLRLRFDVPTFPDKAPKKWDASFNTAQFTLALCGIADLEIVHFHPCECGDLSLERVAGRIELRYASSTCSICGTADFAWVEKISGYCSQGKE